ncbi:MAG: hypothetical protein KAG14_03915, partial [Mycoplasmataceae bacterium]|nr:hypothetical protein [Mycoplasmataceae bacterium]
NCFYDESDEYHDLFINSHGIIHDCGSFLPEYLYTDNPPCYLLENKESIETYFNDIGIECLKNYYHAYNELDILKYIDEVVVKNNDRMKDSRLNFANKKIKIKHPTSSKTIIKIIERSVGII